MSSGRPIRCGHCGEPIVLADDGSRWLHEAGYGWRAQCAPTFAEPTFGGAA